MRNLHYKGSQAGRALGRPLARALKRALPPDWRPAPIYIRILEHAPALDRCDEQGRAGQTLVWRWDPGAGRLSDARPMEASRLGDSARGSPAAWALVANAYWSGDRYAWWLYLVAPGYRPPAAEDDDVRGI